MQMLVLNLISFLYVVSIDEVRGEI